MMYVCMYVAFAIRYDICGRLGSGNFSDVFLVRGYSPPNSPSSGDSEQSFSTGLYAVKKTKYLLRSRKDRDTQLLEVRIYEHLARCARVMLDIGDQLSIAQGLQHIVKYVYNHEACCLVCWFIARTSSSIYFC